MSIFGNLFGKKAAHSAQIPPEQAVIVYLDGTDLPAEVYQNCDLATIEDRLTEVIERDGLGEFDGNEVGPTEAILFMYGPDAERLFSGVEQTLRDYPLCKGARVLIRRGKPGAEQREIIL